MLNVDSSVFALNYLVRAVERPEKERERPSSLQRVPPSPRRLRQQRLQLWFVFSGRPWVWALDRLPRGPPCSAMSGGRVRRFLSLREEACLQLEEGEER